MIFETGWDNGILLGAPFRWPGHVWLLIFDGLPIIFYLLVRLLQPRKRRLANIAALIFFNIFIVAIAIWLNWHLFTLI
jgi:hypothetical protein